MLHAILIAPFAEFEFMRRALVGSIALALSAGPVGVFLMLRRLSLTGDAMAHALLPGVALAYLVAGYSVAAMTAGGLIAGLVVALLAGVMARTTVLREDATLAGFYLISLAAGVLLISVRGSQIDLFHVLFGNVLAIDDQALILLAGIATVTLLVLALVFRPLVLDIVDAGFLRSVSGSGPWVHLTFLVLVTINLVGAFQALGTLLGVAMMVIPALIARLWSADVGIMVPIAALAGLAANTIGLLLAFHWDLPTGPTIVLTAGAIAAVSVLVGRSGGLIWSFLPRKHLEA